MTLILSIETATTVCSVALHKEGELLALSETFLSQSHSVFLSTMIQEVLEKAERQLTELSAVAISKGPGSYTGLRIGTSTVKGICYALDLPLIAVNTLEAMAENLRKTIPLEYWFCPMIDARRMEVYCAVFNQNLEEVIPTQAKIIEENAFIEELSDNKIVFFGNGAMKCWQYLTHSENSFLIENLTPSAKGIGSLAFEKWKSKGFENLAYFEPFYLKDFIGTKPKKII